MKRQELKKLPKHLAIIIDGNGRWAKKRGLPRSMGHKAGFRNLEKILNECFFNYNISIISVYAFSSENWKRPQNEIDYLMDMFRKYLSNHFEEKYPDVKFNLLGDINALPEDIANNCVALMEKTKNRKEKIFNLAVNYSGQDELVNAFNCMIKAGETNVNRKTIEKYLYTCGQPPVDFCIRTSGEQRLSNFMLWQLAYAELYFPSVYWPSFSKKDLHNAFLEYQKRDRRFGAIEEQDE